MIISDEATKSHRDSITCSKAQWLNWIQTQPLCLPILSEVGVRDTGSHCQLTQVPWETLRVRQVASQVFSELRTKSWMKVNNTRSLCKSGRAQPKRTPGVVLSTGLFLWAPLRAPTPCPGGAGEPRQKSDLKMLSSPQQAGWGERYPYPQTHMHLTVTPGRLLIPVEFPPKRRRGSGLSCQSWRRAGEFHILPWGNQGEDSWLLHHQT